LLRERLAQWVCQILPPPQQDENATVQEGEERGRGEGVGGNATHCSTVSGLHRVQAVLEVVTQVLALPLRVPPVVLDASPHVHLDLRITPAPRRYNVQCI